MSLAPFQQQRAHLQTRGEGRELGYKIQATLAAASAATGSPRACRDIRHYQGLQIKPPGILSPPIAELIPSWSWPESAVRFRNVHLVAEDPIPGPGDTAKSRPESHPGLPAPGRESDASGEIPARPRPASKGSARLGRSKCDKRDREWRDYQVRPEQGHASHLQHGSARSMPYRRPPNQCQPDFVTWHLECARKHFRAVALPHHYSPWKTRSYLGTQ